MEICCIIPARGGSKGIKNKNIIDLNGKPLIAYTINTALSVPSISRVIVSTDHYKIAKISRKYGAEVVNRPSEISTDKSASEETLIHVINYLKKNENYLPDLIVFLQCTSPLTTSQDIEETIALLINENADSAFSASPFHYFLWSIDSNGEAEGVNHDKKGKRILRQQIDTQFRETGAIYVMRTKQFMEIKNRFFGKTLLHITPASRTYEIDEPEDLDYVKYKIMNNQNSNKLR